MHLVTGIPLVTSPLSILVVPFSFLAGLLLSGVAMCYTAKTAHIDGFNFPIFLFVTPMFLFTGTFFQLSALPDEETAHRVTRLLQSRQSTHDVFLQRICP